VSVNAPLTSPTNDITILTSDGGTFRWPSVDGATRYYLQILRNGSVFDARWVDGTEWVPNYTFPQGSYTWTVRSWSPAGFGAVSDSATFDITGRPQALGPSGTISADGLVFTWTAVSDATRYQVVVEKDGAPFVTKWVDGATQWTPALTFAAGSYRWTVQPWNAAGFGLKSAPAEFAILAVGGADAPTAITPSGMLADPTGVTFTWTLLPNARWYRVILEKDGEVFAVEWLDNVDSWSPGVPIVDGVYRWTVQSWSPAGFGALSNSVVFSYGVPIPPSPTGLSTTGTDAVTPVVGLLSSRALTAAQFEGIAGSPENPVESSPDPAAGLLAPANNGSPDPETMAAISVAGALPAIPGEADGSVTGADVAGEDDSAVMSEAAEDLPDLSIQDTGLELLGSLAYSTERRPSNENPAAGDIQIGDGANPASVQTGETGTDLMSPTMGYIVPLGIIVGPMSDYGLKQNTSTDKKLDEEPDGNGDGGGK
jgi:hypothetical protein